ncbi:hypothetical protein BASA81_006589 [Batrachochytrium salamandrivorans]|nr:hypothetical protein BASA81_006589 [Batrachochytrium salamandrivorans]
MVSLPAGVQVQKPVGVLCTVHKCMASATAQLLHQARRLGFKLHDIPIKIRPTNLDQAYRAQFELETLYNCKRVGFKAANTNQTSQRFLNLPEPFFGPLLESPHVGQVGTPNSPARINLNKLQLRLCEPEVALQVGSNGEVVAMAPALEIVHSSFLQWTHKNVGAYSLIADLACNGAWVRGEAVPIASNLSVGCEFWVNGKLAGEGHSDNVKPLQVYAKLLERFQPKPGDWITTGVVCDPPYHYGQRGDLLEARFSNGLGAVAVRLE